MEQILIGTVLLFAGIASIIFKERSARLHASIQKETVGIKLSEKANKINEKMSVFFGLILVVLGVLTLLGIAKWNG